MQSGDWKDLINACIIGDLEVVSYYLSHEVDLNFQHPEIMTTPLVESTRMGHYEIVKILLDKGADPKLKTLMGESALKLARKNKAKEVLRLLTS